MEASRHEDLRLGDGLMRLAAVLVTAALLLPACTSGTQGRPTSAPTTPPTTSPPTTTTTAPPTTAPPVDRARALLARMSEAERVGQLFMVDCPSTGVATSTVTAIQRYHVGSVILDGTTTQGVAATAAVAAQLQRLAPSTTQLFIATDQEGGQVQRLQGPGFSTVPSAVEQGTWAPATVQAQATGWGRELRTAGVNVDLAPVLDTVPAGFGSNPPIGDLDRQYGATPAAVSAHGTAFARGLAAAGVAATVKHFPGLGRTRGNTDLTSGVLDTVTTRHDPYLAPFAAAVRQRVPFVMMSTAIYARIDPDRPAAFSPTIVTGMLRHDLGFRGVIVSDDIGHAAQVSGYSVGARAVAFIAAGGTMVLTVDATQAGEMTAAVRARAQASHRFRAQVDAAALVVLRAKLARGLLH